MKKYFIFSLAVVACVMFSGCAYRIGNVQGVINPFLMPMQGYGYYQTTTYQNAPICRPWYGHIVCENVIVPQTMYYNNAPFNPGYAWNSWYTEPGFTVFIDLSGRHHRYNSVPLARQQQRRR